MRDQYKGKSYNQVMNEWAAQRSFLKRAGSSLLRPPMSSQGGSLLWGWTWRLILMVLIPALLYMGWMRFHMKSGDWNIELQNQVKRHMGGAETTVRRARWDFNGELRMEKLSLKGAPSSFFAEAEAVNLATWITIPAVFKKAWHLKNVDAYSGAIHLRNGKPAPAVANTDASPALLTAGWGISPDFSQLEIDSYSCRSLRLSWGSNPANAGALTGTAARMVRNGSTWETTFEGGTAQQGWLGNLKLTSLRVNITPSEARLEKGDFVMPGGGSGSITGGVTLTETPEVKATVLLENAESQNFLAESLQNIVQFKCGGRVDISGSTNRNSGIILDAKLSVKSGTLRSLPILRTLEIITGEPRLSHPTIVGGNLNFTSQGASESGSTIIEGKDLLLDCGALMKFGLTFRHERKPVLAENIKDAQPGAASVSVDTSATLRIGLAPELASKLNSAIRTEFGVREEGGLQWITIPYASEETVPTKKIAERMLELQPGN